MLAPVLEASELTILTKWWFWVSLPLVWVFFSALDRLLLAYNRRYWAGRGEMPPPRRSGYSSAGRHVMLAAAAGAACVLELFRADFGWAVAFAAAGVVWGVLAVRQARRTVI
jgi:hypothetical protein